MIPRGNVIPDNQQLRQGFQCPEHKNANVEGETADGNLIHFAGHTNTQIIKYNINILNFDRMVVQMKLSEGHPQGTSDIWTKCQSNPSNNCRYISLKTTNQGVMWSLESVGFIVCHKIPNFMAVHLQGISLWTKHRDITIHHTPTPPAEHF